MVRVYFVPVTVYLHLLDRDSSMRPGRFNYLYSEAEIKEWVPRIKEISSQVKIMHVVFNNCYDDKAVRNARQMGLLFD